MIVPAPVSPVRIEELPPALFGPAVALWHETGLTRPWNDPDADLRRAMTGPSSTVLAALDSAHPADEGPDRLLGTVMMGHDGHRGWAYYLAVAPVARRRGLGRELMRAGEDWLRAHDIPKMQLMVRRQNVAVSAFYEALGYAYSDVVVMGRRLD